MLVNSVSEFLRKGLKTVFAVGSGITRRINGGKMRGDTEQQ